MSGFFDKVKHTTGLGLNQDELYNRAFAKGVLLGNFKDAADIFEKAARKFTETGDQMMMAQATANSLLYRYLATGDDRMIQQLIQALSVLPQIEEIKSQTETMPVAPLCAELDCRMVETAIKQAQDNMVKLRDLHRYARDKFQAILRNQLLTYSYVPEPDGHNEKTEARYFYHSGMSSFCEAMIKKDSDPAAASDDLALAGQSFRRCNDQKWMQSAATLLENWRVSRTCWMCHREMQGFELHFSMCQATVTPYTKYILDRLKQDGSSVNLESGEIAVCTPCGSMVTIKAEMEADKVRQELGAKIDVLIGAMQSLENRVRHLERNSHHH
ncbi:MAG: hypothetical protein ACRDIV_06955 [Ktedonobacteraceae bacterium]